MVLDRPSPSPAVFLNCTKWLCRSRLSFFAQYSSATLSSYSCLMWSITDLFVVPCPWTSETSTFSSCVAPNAFCGKQICVGLCVDSPFFATQFGAECWCGSSDNYDRHGSSTQCNMDCAGTAGEICGGSNTASVYSNNGV